MNPATMLRGAWLLALWAVSAGCSEVEVGLAGEASTPVPLAGVEFANELDRPAALFWDSGNQDRLIADTVAPRQSVTINSFEGHSFFFAEHGRARDGLLLTVIVQRGQRRYALHAGNAQAPPPARELGGCQDRRPQCPNMAQRGDCERAPGWMIVNCPKSCDACALQDPKLRCDRARLNTTESLAFEPGDMHRMFEGLAAAHGESLGVEVLSTAPWVVTFDRFLPEDEADALWQTASAAGLQRSTDTGAFNQFGEAGKVVSESRTSENAWCRAGCDDHPLVRSAIQRIENVTGVRYGNFEQFQVLRYTEGQRYRVHHDYGRSQATLPCGPRVLTFFLYLSDVEEGGETAFPRLGLKVKPKRGKALLWPSVLDHDLLQQDARTHHEALPVIKGTKLAANAWLHLYDFAVPNHWGCTGAFD